jgi:YaiO family outer membrane protein
MYKKILVIVIVAGIAGSLAAQTPASPQQQALSDPAQGDEPAGLMNVELGGSSNFVNNGYGTWKTLSGRFTFLGGKRFTPSLGFSTQKRPYGSQTNLGMDTYIGGTKWFYMIAGVAGSPGGSAELYPKLSYGITGLFSLPRPNGLVATLAAAQLHGEKGTYGRILTVGGLYYHGKSIWSANLSFNRTYPGAMASKSGNVGVQYGANNKYWVGAGIGGGRVAYKVVSLYPLDVRSYSFGPTIFLQKWITKKSGIIVRYGYQDYLDFFQSHGVEIKVFFEVPRPSGKRRE